MCEITLELLSLAEPEYKAFSSKLIPNIPSDTVLGVRAPLLRAIAKRYVGTDKGKHFLSSLPHKYHEEYLLHAYMIGLSCKDFSACVQHLDAFMPYVESWAVCDSLCASLKDFFKDKKRAYSYIFSLYETKKPYYIRVFLVCLLSYYVSDEYIDTLIELCRTTKSTDYYVNMALSWLISVMLVKEYEKTVSLLYEGILDPWVQNKAIQKARESFRIDVEKKKFLNTLKIKEKIK